MPQSPQPVGPSMRAGAASTVRARGVGHEPHPRLDAARRASTISSSAMSAGPAILPSVRLKPTAKSSRSAGLAIITAWVVPS